MRSGAMPYIPIPEVGNLDPWKYVSSLFHMVVLEQQNVQRLLVLLETGQVTKPMATDKAKAANSHGENRTCAEPSPEIWVGEEQVGQRLPADFRSKIECKYGDKCKDWLAGKCRYYHRGKPTTDKETSATGKGKGNGKERGAHTITSAQSTRANPEHDLFDQSKAMHHMKELRKLVTTLTQDTGAEAQETCKKWRDTALPKLAGALERMDHCFWHISNTWWKKLSKQVAKSKDVQDATLDAARKELEERTEEIQRDGEALQQNKGHNKEEKKEVATETEAKQASKAYNGKDTPTKKQTNKEGKTPTSVDDNDLAMDEAIAENHERVEKLKKQLDHTITTGIDKAIKSQTKCAQGHKIQIVEQKAGDICKGCGKQITQVKDKVLTCKCHHVFCLACGYKEFVCPDDEERSKQINNLIAQTMAVT